MTSFRCGGHILDAANAVASRIGTGATAARQPPLQVPPLAPRPEAAQDGSVVLARVETDEDEAAWVADRLAAELDGGTAAGEMAVLVRRRADFARLHRPLVGAPAPVTFVAPGALS